MVRKCKNIPIPRERNVGTHNAVRTAERGPTAGPFLWHGRERGTAVWSDGVGGRHRHGPTPQKRGNAVASRIVRYQVTNAIPRVGSAASI
uniref:Uncharacterized protein n=1 Tax=Oryza rufipogon TaxID=4529 RepID=A0A0E0RHS7_ORYRU